MKIITWNVNSIRTRLERLVALLERHQPDLVCLQETKVTDDLFPYAELEAAGYRAEVFGQKTYNGVALLSREPLADVERGFPENPVPEEARVIAGTLPAGELGGLKVLNLYVVNGKAVGTDKYERKLLWLDRLTDWIRERRMCDEPFLVLGDFNIAPDDRDVWDPARWRGKILCSPPERERFGKLLDLGLADLFREVSDESGHFTWWDYRMGAFHRGWGLRIDLLLGSSHLAARPFTVETDREERKSSSGPGKPSDHAPVIVTLDV